jgi:hypothetical protein
MKGINTDWDKPICIYLWQLIMKSKPSYPLAILEAVFVNIIWTSSFIFVKLLLKNLGPLTIGGLRYFIGFLVLLPFMLRKGRLDALPTQDVAASPPDRLERLHHRQRCHVLVVEVSAGHHRLFHDEHHHAARPLW